jgi:hypothetical protein
MEQIKVLKDRAEVLSVLLDNSAFYWNNISNILKYPVLIFSTGLLIINTYFKETDKNIKIPNITLNACNILLLGIINNLDLTKKIENFKTKSLDFLELIHYIDGKILLGDVNNDIVINTQSKYDEIYKNILLDAIPYFIKSRVHKKFKGKKHLPLFLFCIESETNSISSQQSV